VPRRWGSRKKHRRRGVARVEVPRGDVEVDIDMESIKEGIYLWGSLVTDRPGRDAVRAGYHLFCTWTPITSEGEAALFAEFSRWLTKLSARPGR
jgi:hypothetical protein